MIPFEIRPVEYSPPLFGALLREAPAERALFLLRLEREWVAGIQRFDRPGEILLGAFADGQMVGVGGITWDPYAPAQGLGRVRHLYVLRDFRRMGLARALMQQLLDHGRKHFATLRLTTERREAMKLYESLGFERREGLKQTHRIEF